MSDNSKFNWKISAHTLPISYIILICLGYTEKSLFYEEFGINIAPYLSFEEYLFIFLPIGSALVMVFFLFSTYIAGIIGANFALFENSKGILNRYKQVEKIESGNPNLNIKKPKKIKSILAYILIAILILSPILILLYFGFNRLILGNTDYEVTKLTTIASFIWGLVMLVLIFSRLPKKEDYKSSLLLYAFLMAFFIPISIICKIHQANYILSGNSNLNVTFKQGEHKIFTNDSIKFIGQTKEYLFMRNLNTDGNIIYRKEDIDEITFTKKTFANNGSRGTTP